MEARSAQTHSAATNAVAMYPNWPWNLSRIHDFKMPSAHAGRDVCMMKTDASLVISRPKS